MIDSKATAAYTIAKITSKQHKVVRTLINNSLNDILRSFT